MNSRQMLPRTSLACLLSALLAACGGADEIVPASAPASLSSPERISAFVGSYNGSLGALTTTSGLASADLVDLFDERYLDSGQTKQQVRDSLKQEADAMGGGTGLPAAVFPAATLADAALSNCDEASGICTLTATVVNADVDTTRATISTQVRFSDGKFRFYGDQQVAST